MMAKDRSLSLSHLTCLAPFSNLGLNPVYWNNALNLPVKFPSYWLAAFVGTSKHSMQPKIDTRMESSTSALYLPECLLILQEQAEKMARMLAEELDYCGVLAVEFFVDTNDQLMINEMAPRPHNSGHFTLDACLTDQFQQQVRTLCGFRPGKTDLTSPAVMVNILGDAWEEGIPAWNELLTNPGIFLHLYGKKEPRTGRKMGHFTCVGENIDTLLETATSLKKVISPA